MHVDERMVEKEIKNLQLAFNEQVFSWSTKLMLEKLFANKDLHKFSHYFSKQWLSHWCYWVRRRCSIYSLYTNNGLETLNGHIKQH
jgi:hypothetical protein